MIKDILCWAGFHDWSSWKTVGGDTGVRQNRHCYRCGYWQGREIYTKPDRLTILCGSYILAVVVLLVVLLIMRA